MGVRFEEANLGDANLSNAELHGAEHVQVVG
ncbi:pentapeptide repeat-containing protein [Micromonospora sp. 050-3]